MYKFFLGIVSSQLKEFFPGRNNWFIPENTLESSAVGSDHWVNWKIIYEFVAVFATCHYILVKWKLASQLVSLWHCSGADFGDKNQRQEMGKDQRTYTIGRWEQVNTISLVWGEHTSSGGDTHFVTVSVDAHGHNLVELRCWDYDEIRNVTRGTNVWSTLVPLMFASKLNILRNKVEMHHRSAVLFH